QALKMKRAHVHGVAQLRERETLLRIGVQRGARTPDDFQLARQAARLASLAVAKARGARGGGVGKERDVLATRLPGRAGWPAEHACRLHPIEESAVGARLAAHDGGPA